MSAVPAVTAVLPFKIIRGVTLASIPPCAMAEGELCNLRGAQRFPGHASFTVQFLLDRFERSFQFTLLNTGRQVAACALCDPAHHIRDPP